MKRGQLLRAFGVAGMAGVAAGGVVVARQQRQRAALTADQVRERLQSRHVDGARPEPSVAREPSGGREPSFPHPPGELPGQSA